MKVILIGSGGCMRELAWQIFEQNERENANWQIIGFVDKEPPSKKVFVNNIEIPYLGNDDYLLNLKEPTNVVLTIGSPILREKIVNKIRYTNIFCISLFSIVFAFRIKSFSQHSQCLHNMFVDICNAVI